MVKEDDKFPLPFVVYWETPLVPEKYQEARNSSVLTTEANNPGVGPVQERTGLNWTFSYFKKVFANVW